MLQQLLLVFTVFGVVYCQANCPIFSALKNDVSLIKELNGTFYKIFTIGTSVVADCQKQTFIIGPSNNILTGYFESIDWCLHLHNCNSSNRDYYQCDLTPVTSGLATLPSTQRNSIKLVEQIGAGDSLCLLYSYCRIGEEGAYVLCRQPPQFLLTLLLEVVKLLTSLLGLIIPVPSLKLVNQVNCTLLNNCLP